MKYATPFLLVAGAIASNAVAIWAGHSVGTITHGMGTGAMLVVAAQRYGEIRRRG